MHTFTLLMHTFTLLIHMFTLLIHMFTLTIHMFTLMIHVHMLRLNNVRMWLMVTSDSLLAWLDTHVHTGDTFRNHYFPAY